MANFLLAFFPAVSPRRRGEPANSNDVVPRKTSARATRAYVPDALKAGYGALNTQSFSPPVVLTLSWWGGSVPQLLGEAKSTKL